MTRDELKRLIRGPIATLPTAMDDAYRLDLDTMAELSRWWVASGLTAERAPLKVAAAMGEGPDLDDEEWLRLLKTVVEAAGPEASVICALKPKNTLHTIEDAKRAQDLGAIGLQIDLPIFHHPTQDDMVRFFTDVSDAIEIGIMIYNTWWFGVPSLSVESLRRLGDAEHVVAIKWTVPPSGGPDYDDMRHFAADINVIDNSNQPVRAYRNGARGFIDPTTAIHPAHALAVSDLLEAGKYEQAEAAYEAVKNPLRDLMAKSAQRSGGYRVIKGMMAAIGRPVGPPRPPTLPMDAAELAELRAVMAGWGWPVVAA